MVLSDRVGAEGEVGEGVAVEAGEEVLGKGSVLTLKESSMGGEDFSYYLQSAPGAIFRLGIGRRGEAHPAPLHNPRYDFNDEAIEPGIKVLAAVALRCLDGKLRG